MKPVRIPISDGISLNLIYCDKFKTDYISVDFLTELSEENSAKNALLPSVLMRGSEKYPSVMEMTKALDMLYGSHISSHVSKIGEIQSFGFSSYPLGSDYAEGDDVSGGILKMLKDIIFNPCLENGTLKPEYVESEKQVLIDRIRAQINNKQYYSIMRCREEMCRGEVYAIPETGTEAAVAAISPESLTEHFKEIFGKTRVEIYCIGKFDTAAITSGVKDLFAGLERTAVGALTTNQGRLPDEVRRVNEKQPVRQGKLCLGFRTGCEYGSADMPALSLFFEILGGSATSKLFMNVREKLSLCYYCSAMGDTIKGIMLIASGIEVSDREKAEEAILKEVEMCRSGNITEEELEYAKKSIENNACEMNDSAGALKAWYMKRSLAGLTDSPEEYAAAIRKVSTKDVAAVARKSALDTIYFLEGTQSDENGEGVDNE